MATACLAASARGDGRCPAIAGGSSALAAADAAERLHMIQRGLGADARNARIWAWTWAGLYATSLGINAGRIPLSSHDTQIDAAVATAGSAIGLSMLGILPLTVMGDQRRLDALVAAAPSDGDRCALLAEAERLLVRDARSEEFGRGALANAGNFVLNIGLGLLLGIGYGHWTAASITTLSGIAVGEVQFATQPTGAVDLLGRYRRGDLAGRAAEPRGAFRISPSVGGGQYSLQFGLQF